MRNKAILDDLLFETFAHVKNKDEMTLNTRVAPHLYFSITLPKHLSVFLVTSGTF